MKANAIFELVDLGVSRVKACALLGYSRASFYRHHVSPPHPPTTGIAQAHRHQPAALTDSERAEILEVLDQDEYSDLSVTQTFYRYWDTGNYIASLSSWHRVARDHGHVGDLRGQSRHDPRKKPELVATAPNQVWSWDITKLCTTKRGVYFHLYVIVDIYSRLVVGWALHDREDGALAQELIDRAQRVHGIPRYIHSDNGGAMVSSPVAELAVRLGVTLSFSRPKTSNDNPFSEALFKTCKYQPVFPRKFETRGEAHQYCDWFFPMYNTEHRHCAIAFHTPHSVHHGQTARVSAVRRAAVEKTWRARPERFARKPRPPRLPRRSHINKPEQPNPTNLSQSG